MTKKTRLEASDRLDIAKLRARCFDGLGRALDRGMRSAMFMNWLQCCLTAMNKARSMQSLSFDMLYQWDSTRRQWQPATEATNDGGTQ